MDGLGAALPSHAGAAGDSSAGSGQCAPLGKPLENKGTTSEKSGGGRRIRTRYQAEAPACADCPLRSRCVSGEAKSRQVGREQYEEHRERQAEKMALPESQDLYNLQKLASRG